MTNMRPTRACAPLTSLEIHTHANLYIFVQVSPKITYVPLENSTHQIEFLQYISNSKEYCFNTKLLWIIYYRSSLKEKVPSKNSMYVMRSHLKQCLATLPSTFCRQGRQVDTFTGWFGKSLCLGLLHIVHSAFSSKTKSFSCEDNVQDDFGKEIWVHTPKQVGQTNLPRLSCACRSR